MAITIKFYTIVTRVETIERKYPGGLDAYVRDNRVGSSYRDENIVGVISMGSDVEQFIAKLVNLGFSYVVNDEFGEIALVDMFYGPLLPCPWLETSICTHFNKKESTCWLKESKRYIMKKNKVKARKTGVK